jgi:transcriptional regulator with XRE-family HTH domain
MMQGSLAEKLRVLRARMGLSLTEAAGRAGVTRDTLSDLEHGKRHPYMPTLSKIAAGYGVPVEDLLEEPALAGKAKAPIGAGHAEALTVKVTEIQKWYRARRDGLVLLCERWEQRLASLGEDPDGEMLREMLDDMTIVGTYLTDFFEKAAVDEAAETWTTLGSVDNKGAGLTDNEALATATKVSIMKPALERWQRLGNEIHRLGVEMFGEAAAYVEFPEIAETPPSGRIPQTPPVERDELAKRRAEKLRRAS